MRQERSERFGQMASVRDVLWSLSNEGQIANAAAGQWGLHRNAWYHLALLAEARGDLRQARGSYFYICHLDLTDLLNVAYRGQPPLDPEQGSLAPGIVGNLGVQLVEFEHPPIEVVRDFLSDCAERQRQIGLPLAPHRALEVLEIALERRSR